MSADTDDRTADDRAAGIDDPLTRTAASEAVEGIGWRYVLGALAASVPVASTAQAVRAASAAAEACAVDADGHLRLDLRPDRVEVSLTTRARSAVTGRDVELAHAVAGALDGLGLGVAPPTTQDGRRPVQALEIAVDALDIAAVRPFWAAVLGLADEPGREGPEEGLVDPAGQLPAVWFQQMDASREQRNRIHLDLTVAHDEADGRVAAALAAGGRLLDGSHARAFWVLADPEGNEVCVCTWADRDGDA